MYVFSDATDVIPAASLLTFVGSIGHDFTLQIGILIGWLDALRDTYNIFLLNAL